MTWRRQDLLLGQRTVGTEQVVDEGADVGRTEFRGRDASAVCGPDARYDPAGVPADSGEFLSPSRHQVVDGLESLG
jgi:hypothetical protein